MDLRERPHARPSSAPACRHPWEQARAGFVVELLRGAGVLQPGARILDVGAGDAWLASELWAAAGSLASITCVDTHYSDDDLGWVSPGIRRRRDLPGRVRSGTEARTDDGAAGDFDVALLLDVLEHVDDAVALARETAALVRPGGRVLVTVPAWPQLFSSHDVALDHRRRYTPTACAAVLQAAGLRILEAGGLFHGLLAPRTLTVVWERVQRGRGGQAPSRAPARVSEVGHWGGGPVVTAAITAALRAEHRLSRWASRRRWQVPGLSYFAWCQVPLERRGVEVSG